MAHKFGSDEKEVKTFSDRLKFGVHRVQLLTAQAGETADGKDFIELEIISEDKITETVRLWFTGGATNISFNTLRQIAVHNAKTEDEKAKVGAAIDACADSDELATVFGQAAMGGELWFTKYYDPTRTYMAKDGKNRRSVNTNVYGYEPKLKPELMPDTGAGDFIDSVTQRSAEDKAVPFGSDGDAAGSHVPKDDSWA